MSVRWHSSHPLVMIVDVEVKVEDEKVRVNELGFVLGRTNIEGDP